MGRGAALLVVALSNCGCLVSSLQPVYDKGAIRYDPALVGTWEDEDRRFSVAVASGPWQSYRVTVTAQSRETALVGYEFVLGRSRFVDLTPEHGLEAGPVVVPTHAVARFSVSGDRLELRPLDYDWFRAGIEKSALENLSAVLDERENVLVTAAADGLRSWIAANHARDGVLGPPLVFRRRP
jgi:hypothetical protein